MGLLTSVRFRVFSEITRDMGQIFFASLFVGPLVDGGVNWIVIVLGLLATIIAWGFSVVLYEKAQPV